MYLLILTIPIILLYILKLRVNTAVTAATFLWRQVLQEQRSVQHWQIRRVISLLLSILFVVMLALAVWNPSVHLPEYKPFIKQKEAQLAITRFTPRRSLDEPVNYEVLAEVSNTGTAAAETVLGVQLNNTFLSAIPLTVPANSVKQTVIQEISPSGGVLLCTLIPQKETENPQKTAIRKSTILPPVSMQRILLCGEDNIYLKNALQSLPDTEVITAKELPSEIAAAIPKNNILVLNGSVPAELPTGNILVFNPQNDTQLFSTGEPVSIPLVSQTDEDSPLVKQLGLTNTFFQGAKVITPKINANMNVRILADTVSETADKTTERIPLYLLIETAERRVLVFNADLKKCGITPQTTFPLLLSRALRYFGSEQNFSLRNASLQDTSEPQTASFTQSYGSGFDFGTRFPLAAVCLFWTAAEWLLFLRRKLE